MEFYNIDVIHEDLEEVVYIEHPPRFNKRFQDNIVCKLRKGTL